MTAGEIFLVVVSGLGVFHGLLLAFYLWGYPKGVRLSNRLLSVLLLVLSFRIGKSVFLEFAQNIDVKLIFTGLGSLMMIGPLFYLYTLSLSDRNFRITTSQIWHFVPSFLGIAFGLWLKDEHLQTLPLWFFGTLFLSYYLHYLIYLLISRRKARKERGSGLNDNAYQLLTLMFYGLLVIWVAYVTNLFDDDIPYVVGPVLYSIVAYFISFRVIQKGYIQQLNHKKYSTTPVSDDRMDQVYNRVLEIVVTDQQYRDADLSLKALGEKLNVNTQTLSMVINQKSGQNFNAFVNQHRVEDAKRLLADPAHQHQTIAAIAYEAGFNSISSFNTAFKQFTQQTPANYRKQMMTE